MLATLGFLLVIGVLVIVHEFGHYLFARLFGVKVISFSIGFGPKLIKWQGKHNEWCISLIPLGGYVAMLDERVAEVANELKPFAYNQKPPYQKLLIAFAGPLFNILFAFFAYYAMGLYGVYTLKPVIESIHPTPLVQNLTQIPVASNLLSLNNLPISSWSDAEDIFSDQLKNTNIIKFQVSKESTTQEISLDLTKFKNNVDSKSLIELGLYPFKYLPIISYVEPSSRADVAGLRDGDKVLSVNNIPITSWFDLSNIIRSSPSNKLSFLILRKNAKISVVVTPESFQDDNGQIIGKVGIMPTLDSQLLTHDSYIKKYTFVSGLPFAFKSCISTLEDNWLMVTMMIQGKVSWHNIGGPVSIAKASEVAIHQGVKAFIDLLALVSLSIAFMNLLPIPVLDGGHIVIYAFEWIFKKPIDDKLQQVMFSLGLVVVLSFTALALYNDFMKLLNW